MDKLKVGIIGSGKMGLLHAGIFNTLDQTKITCISEEKSLLINGLRKYLNGITIYEDYREMLERENLDIIVITTPVFLHKQMIIDAMKQQLHIFVEKPLALNHAECKKILEKPYTQKSLVGYCRRFMGTFNLAKKIIDKSVLGNLNYFHGQLFVAQVFQEGTGWLYHPQTSGGGVLIDLGSHALDLCQYLFGNLSTVHALAEPVFNREVEDYVSINMRFKRPLFGSLQVAWSIRNYRLPELKLTMHFDRGTVTTTEKYVTIYAEQTSDFIKKGWSTFYKQNLTQNVPIDLGGPDYTLEDLHFVTCIRDNKETRCDFREATKTNLLIDGIYQSINEECVVKIVYEE
jgi:predicted dehydrogenase